MSIMAGAFHAADKEVLGTAGKVYSQHLACTRSGYFDVMNLRSDDDIDHQALKKRRKVLMLRYHPDKNKNTNNHVVYHEMTSRINEAFHALSRLVDAVDDVVRRCGNEPTEKIDKADLEAICEVLLKLIVSSGGDFLPMDKLTETPQIALLFPQKTRREAAVRMVMDALARDGFCTTMLSPSSSHLQYCASSKTRTKVRAKRNDFRQLAKCVRFDGE